FSTLPIGKPKYRNSRRTQIDAFPCVPMPFTAGRNQPEPDRARHHTIYCISLRRVFNPMRRPTLFETTMLSKEEFHAYLLAFAIQSDYTVTPEEKEYVLSRIPIEDYQKASRILSNDNDIEAIERILENLRFHGYEGGNPERIIAEIE